MRPWLPASRSDVARAGGAGRPWPPGERSSVWWRGARGWLGPGLVVLSLLYPVLLLWPYRWEPPTRMVNAAVLSPGGGVEFPGPGLLRTEGPPRWLATAIRTGQLDVALSVRTGSPDQSGPARILTVSANRLRRNLTIGQQGDDLVVRLRTSGTTPNGTLDGKAVARIADVFRYAGWVDVAIRVRPGELRVAVDGQVRVQRPLPLAPLERWDRSFPLALGNELSRNRPWVGSIRRAEVRTGDVVIDYAATPDDLRRPARYWYKENDPKLTPLRDSSPADILVNLLLYVPLGFLLGLARRGARGWGAVQAIGIVAVLSATLEVLQLFVAVRNTSVDDVLFNTLGGAAGVAAAFALARRLVPAPARPRG